MGQYRTLPPRLQNAARSQTWSGPLSDHQQSWSASPTSQAPQRAAYTPQHQHQQQSQPPVPVLPPRMRAVKPPRLQQQQQHYQPSHVTPPPFITLTPTAPPFTPALPPRHQNNNHVIYSTSPTTPASPRPKLPLLHIPAPNTPVPRSSLSPEAPVFKPRSYLSPQHTAAPISPATSHPLSTDEFPFSPVEPTPPAPPKAQKHKPESPAAPPPAAYLVQFMANKFPNSEILAPIPLPSPNMTMEVDTPPPRQAPASTRPSLTRNSTPAAPSPPPQQRVSLSRASTIVADILLNRIRMGGHPYHNQRPHLPRRATSPGGGGGWYVRSGLSKEVKFEGISSTPSSRSHSPAPLIMAV